MKVLIDNCLPIDLRHELTGHEVETATYRGWAAMENGDLVDACVEAGFDVILSIDQGQDFTKAVKGKAIAAVLLPGSQGSRLTDVLPLVDKILEAIPSARRGSIRRVKP